MDLSTIVLLIIVKFSVVLAIKAEVKAVFNETAHLPCDFKNPQNISKEELVIFWQGAKHNVLYEQYRGTEKQNHIHPSYMNRTKFNRSTWTLQLGNVQIVDQGEYKCYIQHLTLKGSVIIHQLPFHLSVFASFSQPEIMRLDNTTVESGNVLNFSCSSKQGYPKPQKICWIVQTKNSTKYSGEMYLSQDGATQLYNVSSFLSLLITDSTSEINITCSLKIQEPEELLTSETLCLKMKPYKEPESNVWIPVVVPTFVSLVVLLIILTVLCLCCKREATRVKEEDRSSQKRSEALEPVNHPRCEKR